LILVSMRADRTPSAWDEGSVTCISLNLPRKGYMSDEVAEIHMAGRYFRDGDMAFAESRAVLATGCVDAEEGNIEFMKLEV